MTIQFTRGLLLAKTESVFNVAEALTASTDAFEVISPDFAPDITTQRRAVVSNDISPFENLVTRKVGKMRFSLEVKSNGNTAASVAPRIGSLLKACGFGETQINTAFENVFRVVPHTDNTGDMNFYGATTTYTGGVYLKARVEITTTGGTGVAVAAITHPAEADTTVGGLNAVAMADTDEVILTDGVEIGLHDNDGLEIARFTPDFQTTNPAVGDVYFVHIRPIGYLYKPITDNIESVTMDIQYPDSSGQAIRHRLIGARGTVAINAAIGGFPTFDFEFTGTYNAQVDETTLEGTFEDTDPVQVEYAAMSIAQRYAAKEVSLCASQWAVDMANNIAIRDCINASEASEGAFLTAREPTVSYDPEAVLASVEPLWSYLENGTSVEWWVRHGTVDGNIVLLHAPNQQITGIGYSDRNNIRVFSIDGSLARLSGNDELEILFT